MQRQRHAKLLRHWRDARQKFAEMLAQHRGSYAAILLQPVAELWDRERFGGGSRQGASDHRDEVIDVGLLHAIIDLPCTSLRAFRIFRGGLGPLQDMKVERREAVLIEAHGAGAVRQFPLEVGAAPVDDGHKVVADDFDAACRDCLEARDPGLDRACRLAPEPLDVIGHRNGFHHRPCQR